MTTNTVENPCRKGRAEIRGLVEDNRQGPVPTYDQVSRDRVSSPAPVLSFLGDPCTPQCLPDET